MVPDIMPAQPTLQHKRNPNCAITSLLPRDLNIYAALKKKRLWTVETGAGGKWDRTGGTVVFKVSIFRIFRDNSRSIIHYTSHHVKSVIIDTDHIAPLGVARLAAPAADNIEKLFEVQHSERKCENISGSCAKSSALSTVLTEVGEKPSLSHIFFVVRQFSSNCRGNEQFSISQKT